MAKTKIYHKWWFWTPIAIFALLVAVGIFFQVSDLNAPQGHRTWRVVDNFMGASSKATETFTVSDNWNISWTTWPGDGGDKDFKIDLYSKSGKLIETVAETSGDKSGQCVYNDSGTYYLDIVGGQMYAIVIEDCT